MDFVASKFKRRAQLHEEETEIERMSYSLCLRDQVVDFFENELAGNPSHVPGALLYSNTDDVNTLGSLR